MEENTRFESLSLCDEILQVANELGFEFLTDIQKASIPVLLKKKDLMGQSKTGSGKTAAFAIPALQNMDWTNSSLQTLILCPTRELSQQVAREFRKWGRKFPGLKVAVLTGGQPLSEQSRFLQGGAHVAIGTPGRILDLLAKKALNFKKLQTLVFDEADKMLEMGFEDEINNLMRQVPAERQTVFFSATYPDSMEDMSRRYQKNPLFITVEDPEEGFSNLEQFIYMVKPNEDKSDILMRVLQQHPSEMTLVFCNQKNTVDFLAEKIADQGVKCAALHGDLNQRQREQVLALFRNKSYRILIATDLAARGLDIEKLDLVINYDMPAQDETFIHRVGRTGRAGKRGQAVSLTVPTDSMRLHELENHFGTAFQKPVLRFKNQHGLGKEHKETAMRTLKILAGRKDKIRAGDILGALTGASGNLSSEDVGKIEIHDKFSFVALSTQVADEAFEKLRSGKIKGRKFPVKWTGE